MVTGPLFKWFGSKWLASKLYPPPDHDSIFEPYAGSAGYSLRHFQKNVTIYDDNEQLKALWSWLINDANYELIKSIPTNIEVGYDIRNLNLSSGQQLLLKHWQRTNTVGNCWTISSWGNKPGQWTESTRERVAREVEFIKHWKFCPITWKEEGTYFVDPPYEFNYRYGIRTFDYDELVQNISSVPESSTVIVCEAACQKTGALPTYLPFQYFGLRITSRRKKTNNHHSKELIYVQHGMKNVV